MIRAGRCPTSKNDSSGGLGKAKQRAYIERIIDIVQDDYQVACGRVLTLDMAFTKIVLEGH
jgi:hypothetical protein